MVTACSVDGSMVVSGLTESPLILSDKPHLSQLQFPAPVFKYAYCTAVFFTNILQTLLETCSSIKHQTTYPLTMWYITHGTNIYKNQVLSTGAMIDTSHTWFPDLLLSLIPLLHLLPHAALNIAEILVHAQICTHGQSLSEVSLLTKQSCDFFNFMETERSNEFIRMKFFNKQHAEFEFVYLSLLCIFFSLCICWRNLKSRSSQEYVHPQRTPSQIRGFIIVQSKECKYLNILEDYCGFRKIIRNTTQLQMFSSLVLAINKHSRFDIVGCISALHYKI